MVHFVRVLHERRQQQISKRAPPIRSDRSMLAFTRSTNNGGAEGVAKAGAGYTWSE